MPGELYSFAVMAAAFQHPDPSSSADGLATLRVCLAREHRSGWEIRTTDCRPRSGKLDSQMSNCVFTPAPGRSRTIGMGRITFVPLASELTPEVFAQAARRKQFGPLQFWHSDQQNAAVRVWLEGTCFGLAVGMRTRLRSSTVKVVMRG